MEENIKIIEECKIMDDTIPHSEHSKRLRKAIENLIKGYRELEKKECYMEQQDDEYSNWYKCSNCNDDFYWGEEPEDLQCSNVNYCPYCGAKIKEIIYIKDEVEEEE